MKKLLVILFLYSFQIVAGQSIQPRPNPPKAVNDFGNFLEPFQEESLERKIRDYNDSTSSAIIIITVPELQGYDISEVALKYMREWKPGLADRDNGVIILVSKTERKARIETGYGMEGVLPDITGKHIIDEVLVPNFKANDYYRGFDQAVDAIMLAAAGEYKATPKKNKGRGGFPFQNIIIIVILLIFLMARGGGGGRGGNYMSRRGSRGVGSGLPWFIVGSLLGGGRGGGGGFGDGGGFGGGGFGGFGGGSGGGGGASGGW